MNPEVMTKAETLAVLRARGVRAKRRLARDAETGRPGLVVRIHAALAKCFVAGT